MTAYFQGAYVNDMRDALIGAIVSGVHLIFIGPPGSGKTAITRDVAMRMVPSEKNFIFIRLDASTPPEVVSGLPDPAEAIATPPRIVYNRDGTFYDPLAMIIGADETYRPSDVIFDKLLDVLNRMDIDPDKAPVVIGTSNFASSTERTEALRDRFGMWYFVQPGHIDPRAVSRAHLMAMGGGHTGRLLTPGHIPTWADVVEARNAEPGPKAMDAIDQLVEDLCSEAAQAGIDINNNRRIEQWDNILFRMGYLYSGKNRDFDAVPIEASKLLKYCYPTPDVKEWQKWSEVCHVISDVVGAAIQAALNTTYAKLVEVRKNNKNDTAAMSLKLGKAMQDGQNSLLRLGKDDPRIKQALDKMFQAYTKVVRGEDPMEG